GEAADVGLLEPDAAQVLHLAVVRQRLRQDDSVDAARRGAGDDVDHDARADLLRGRFVHERDVVRLGAGGQRVVGGTGRDGAAGGRVALRIAVERGRGHGEIVKLARLPVHVNRQRHSAVADDAESQLADGEVLRQNRPYGTERVGG